MIIFDCETEPFRPGVMLPTVIATGTAPGTIETGPPSWWGTQDPDVVFAGFEVAYDFGALAHTYGGLDWVFGLYETGRVVDLRIRWLLFEYAEFGERVSDSYSLENAARMWHIEPHRCKDSSWRTRYDELRGVPPDQWPDEAREYLLEDVRITSDLAEAIPPMPDERAQARYAFALRLASAWGLCTDQGQVDALERRALDARKEADAVLRREGVLVPRSTTMSLFGDTDEKLDVKRARDLVDDVCTANGIDPPLTKGGSVSTSSKALRDLQGIDPAIDALAARGGVASVLNREVPLLRHPVLHTRFDLAVSGRTTSRPNLQNVSKAYGARDCFKPRPDNVFLQYDFPALELRTLAQACIDLTGGSRLADAFAAGADVHQTFADAHLGGNRQLAKAANFGFPGGMQAESFRRHVWQTARIRVEDPKAVREAWLTQWPYVREYMAITARKARRSERIEHLRSGRLRGGCSSTQAGNTFFQGLGADVAKATLWRIVRECYGGSLDGARVVGFVHDEYLLECPIDRAEAYAAVLVRIIAHEWRQWCPDVAMVPEVGDVNISERWVK